MGVRGNFEQKKADEMLYIANIEVASIRCALAITAQNTDWGVSGMDVATAFLNTPLPEDGEQYFVKPPQILVDFHLIDPRMVWRLRRAVYGLRVSPR